MKKIRGKLLLFGNPEKRMGVNVRENRTKRDFPVPTISAYASKMVLNAMKTRVDVLKRNARILKDIHSMKTEFRSGGNRLIDSVDAIAQVEGSEKV